jgi:hypothetical protein
MDFYNGHKDEMDPWNSFMDTLVHSQTFDIESDTSEEAQDREQIRQDMNQEGGFDNQQHYLTEMANRMDQLKGQRQQRQPPADNNKIAEKVVKVKLYRALLDKQEELLSPPTSFADFEQYAKLLSVLYTIKEMRQDNWWTVNIQQLLNQLLAPLDIQWNYKRACCPVSLD